MHDFLLAKNGIAAPNSHPLKLAIIRHKARLHAELTKARLKRGFSSLENLRININSAPNVYFGAQDVNLNGQNIKNDGPSEDWSHPRWVRINTLQTSLEEQLQTTFSGYKVVDTIEKILRNDLESTSGNFLFIDQHIPNLLALPFFSDIQKSSAYLNGMIILQNKASCFPAYLLNPTPEDGDVLDACAAPGNKTTHLAAILQSKSQSPSNCKILACERDRDRALTLQKMITKAGAQDLAIVKSRQDFLRTKPQEPPWNNVHYLLLDPSCSGSGIVGRDETPTVAFAQVQPNETINRGSRKRKRGAEPKVKPATEAPNQTPNSKTEDHDIRLSARLKSLSTFQLKLLQHAFEFPQARKITYSTCSIHAAENEHVVIQALQSPIAQSRHWRILPRDQQISGAKTWTIRGDRAACQDYLAGSDPRHAQEIAEACLRCEKGTKEGTQGFFVAAFVRDDVNDDEDDHQVQLRDQPGSSAHNGLSSDANNVIFQEGEEGDDGTELEWTGFSDEDTVFSQ